MTVGAGKIKKISIDSITEEQLLYEATEQIRITDLQFVSEISDPVELNIFLICKFGQVRIIPRATIESDDLLQFSVKYDLEPYDKIVATAGANEAINYIINGKAGFID